MTHTTCGTPGYVAPEILEQKPYGFSCDYWSIGIVAFILLSGSAPFFETDHLVMMNKIKACEYDFEVETWRNVSDSAKDFIGRILVKEPWERMNCV